MVSKGNGYVLEIFLRVVITAELLAFPIMHTILDGIGLGICQLHNTTLLHKSPTVEQDQRYSAYFVFCKSFGGGICAQRR